MWDTEDRQTIGRRKGGIYCRIREKNKFGLEGNRLENWDIHKLL